MVASMTGFASHDFQDETGRWAIEIRGVNAKGLDIRTRLPENLLTSEPQIRKIFSKLVSRGTINLTVRRAIEGTEQAFMVNASAIEGALSAARQVEILAQAEGVPLAPSRAVDYLALRGVLGGDADAAPEIDTSVILGQIERVAQSFAEMRRSEGALLKAILLDQIEQIDRLVDLADGLMADRQAQMATALRRNIDQILSQTDAVPEERLAQELALLAVKTDITEEMDRLRTHVAGARNLLEQPGPIGRKLDFLTQEFNREANTLCSKSHNGALTQVGLDLKAVVDQMREQVQNVE